MKWGELNQRIAACRRGPQPAKCLKELFDIEPDGHVAMALGQESERAGAFREAANWYLKAVELYRLERFKNAARDASDRVSRQLALQASDALTQPVDSEASGGLPPGEGDLHIVECSRTKVWRGRRDIPRFVRARDAYEGVAMQEWLRDPRSRTHRWLVLSARYGFIDPDQPVEDYDVTFGDAKTGPISRHSLAAQVQHQVRWADRKPLRDFNRVFVHGHNDYVNAVRAAFSGLRAEVITATPGLGSRSQPDTQTERSSASRLPPLTWSRTRAEAIGSALAQVPIEVFTNLDMREPEWPALTDLASWADQELALLTALCLGFTDYQLGHGGADAYWAAVTQELSRTSVSSVDDVTAFMGRLTLHTVSKRLSAQKLDRVHRVATRWADRPHAFSARQLWDWLAAALGQRPEAKTVVMAMKIADLLSLARTGRYLDLGVEVPLPVDLRIARVSFTSGLVLATDGTDARRLLAYVEEAAAGARTLMLDAWRSVAMAAGSISLLRIDSLVWQLGESVGRQGGAETMRQILVRAGCPDAAAARVCQELSVALR